MFIDSIDCSLLRPGFRPSAAWTTFAWQVHAGPCWHTTSRHGPIAPRLFVSGDSWSHVDRQKTDMCLKVEDELVHETSFVRTKYTHQARTDSISMFFPIEIKEFHSRQVTEIVRQVIFYHGTGSDEWRGVCGPPVLKFLVCLIPLLCWKILHSNPFGYICNSFAYVKDTCFIFFEISRHLFKAATCNLCKPQVDLVLECNDGKLLAHRVICCKACPKLLSKLIPCEDRPNSWRLKDWIWHCWGRRRMSTTLLYKGLCSRQLTCKQIKNPFT